MTAAMVEFRVSIWDEPGGAGHQDFDWTVDETAARRDYDYWRRRGTWDHVLLERRRVEFPERVKTWHRAGGVTHVEMSGDRLWEFSAPLTQDARPD